MARRWIFYLALNVLVSAATMLTVLYLWDRSHQPAPLAIPSATPMVHANFTPQPSVYATPTPFLYTVKSGDTLGQIAERFGITVEELIAVNNLADPDWLEPGMQLVIPAGAAGVSRPVSAKPTVTAAEEEQALWPEIDSVVSPGNLFLEAVRITNPGPNTVLTGWKIRSSRGAEYVFGEFSLVARGAVLVHTAEGIDTSIDLYWNLKEILWHPGDEAMLTDPLGNLRSVYVIP
jgi:LysM repeat protein